MNRWITFAFLLLVLPGCAQKLKKPQPSELMYPHGTYQHKVRVQIAQPVRTVDLRGVIKSQPHELKVVGLSTFNTTVFRIDENLQTGEVVKEFYVDTVRQNEERFMFFYSLLKEMLLAPKGKNQFERKGAKFVLSQPDENQIYRTIHIHHPQVNLTIEVTGYEF